MIDVFYLLKSFKGGGYVFWDSVSWLGFKLTFCLFSMAGIHQLLIEKAKHVCFIYIKQQKV